MTARVLNVTEIERRSADGAERLEFRTGVNVIVGEPNSGKTSWLNLLDYVLGDTGSPEDAFNVDLAEKYSSARVLLTVDGSPVDIERRWKERGGRGKVFVDGHPIDAKDFSTAFLEKLGLPRVHIPKGSPYSDNTWPELSWRTLLRHVYRKEWAWHDFADKQPESDQRAVILTFLGAAPAVYSDEYARLIEAQKRLSRLDGQKVTYEQTVHEVARDVVTTEYPGAGITRDSLATAIHGLEQQQKSYDEQRARTLSWVRDEAQTRVASQGTLAIDVLQNLSQQLEAARSRRVVLESEVFRSSERLEDLRRRLDSAREELEKLNRAKAAGAVLVALRVTNCPVCDREVPSHAAAGHCRLCHQPILTQSADERATSNRIEFERNQLKEEEVELADIVGRTRSDLDELQRRLSVEQGEVRRLEQLLEPVQAAAAWVIPAELSVSERETGRIQERIVQLERLRKTLGRRDQLAKDADGLRRDIARLEGEVEAAKAELDFVERGDQLSDAMRDYLNQLDGEDRARWGARQVSVVVSDATVRFLVNGVPWTRSLGAHLRAYLFLAYHYALLKLARTDPFAYPGVAILDFPVNLAEEFGISDEENYLLRPFVTLLQVPGLRHLQLIAAGRAFALLSGAHVVELSPR